MKVNRLRLLAASLVALLGLTACGTMPFDVAETERQKYYATLATYADALETVETILADDRVPDERKAGIRRVEGEVTSVVLELSTTYEDVNSVRAGVKDVREVLDDPPEDPGELEALLSQKVLEAITDARGAIDRLTALF